MGIITGLIKQNQEKKAQDAEKHIRANESLLKLAGMASLPEGRDQLRQMGFDPDQVAAQGHTAVQNITEIYGKNTGKEHKGATGILQMMLGKIAGLNPVPPDQYKNQQGAQLEKKEYSPEQRQELLSKETQQGAERKGKAESTVAESRERGKLKAEVSSEADAASTAATRRKTEAETQEYNIWLGRGKELGLKGRDLAEYAGSKGQKLPAETKPVNRQRVEIKGPDGKKFVGGQDPQTSKIYNIKGEELDPEKYQILPKEPQESSRFRELSDAYRIIKDPKETPERHKAAENIIKDEQQKQQRVVVQIQNAAGGSQKDAPTQAELRALAQNAILTGKDPSLGLSAKDPLRKQYLRAKAQLLLGKGVGEAVAEGKEFQSLAGSLADITKLRGRVVNFEGTAEKNIDQALALSEKVGRTNSSLVNEYLQWAQGKLTDYPDLARLRTAVQTAINEYARVVSSATGGGVSTDTARAEGRRIFDEAFAKGSLRGAGGQMKIEMKNRVQSIDDTLTGIKSNMRSGPNAAAEDEGTGGVPKVGDTFNGGRVLKVTKLP